MDSINPLVSVILQYSLQRRIKPYLQQPSLQPTSGSYSFIEPNGWIVMNKRILSNNVSYIQKVKGKYHSHQNVTNSNQIVKDDLKTSLILPQSQKKGHQVEIDTFERICCDKSNTYNTNSNNIINYETNQQQLNILKGILGSNTLPIESSTVNSNLNKLVNTIQPNSINLNIYNHHDIFRLPPSPHLRFKRRNQMVCTQQQSNRALNQRTNYYSVSLGRTEHTNPLIQTPNAIYIRRDRKSSANGLRRDSISDKKVSQSNRCHTANSSNSNSKPIRNRSLIVHPVQLCTATVTHRRRPSMTNRMKYPTQSGQYSIGGHDQTARFHYHPISLQAMGRSISHCGSKDQTAGGHKDHNKYGHYSASQNKHRRISSAVINRSSKVNYTINGWDDQSTFD